MSDTEFDDERRQKMEELFHREWGDQDESPLMEFIKRMKGSDMMRGGMMVLHALPQMQCDCARCFYEKVQLAEYFVLHTADFAQKLKDGEVPAIIDRGKQLYKQLAEEGLDASDMLTMAGLLLNGMLFSIAKAVTDKGRTEL